MRGATERSCPGWGCDPSDRCALIAPAIELAHTRRPRRASCRTATLALVILIALSVAAVVQFRGFDARRTTHVTALPVPTRLSLFVEVTHRFRAEHRLPTLPHVGPMIWDGHLRPDEFIVPDVADPLSPTESDALLGFDWTQASRATFDRLYPAPNDSDPAARTGDLWFINFSPFTSLPPEDQWDHVVFAWSKDRLNDTRWVAFLDAHVVEVSLTEFASVLAEHEAVCEKYLGREM